MLIALCKFSTLKGHRCLKHQKQNKQTNKQTKQTNKHPKQTNKQIKEINPPPHSKKFNSQISVIR